MKRCMENENMPLCVTCFEIRDSGIKHKHGEFGEHFHCDVCVLEEKELHEYSPYCYCLNCITVREHSKHEFGE